MSSTTSDMSHRQKCIANVFIGVSPEYRIVLDTQLLFVQKLSHVSLFVTPWTAACQASLSFTISQFSSIQSLSHVWLLVIPWNAAHQASLSITNSQSLLKLMSLSRWCHPTISSSFVPFSSHLQNFPTSRSFPVNQFFASGGQSIGVSASASVLPMNIQDWFPLGWTGWISLQSKGLSRVFSNTTVQKHQFFCAQFSL